MSIRHISERIYRALRNIPNILRVLPFPSPSWGGARSGAVFIFVLSLSLSSCSSSDDPIANPDPEPVWSNASLPQGNHDYDNTILEWNRKYDILPLYRFQQRDYEWNVTSHNTWKYDSISDRTQGGIEVEVADTNYVGDLLSLIQTTVLQYFPDSVVKNIFPQKLLLANTITNVGSTFSGKSSDYALVNCFSGYDFLIFAGANSKTASMSAADRDKYKADAMNMLFRRAIDNGDIEVPEAFSSISTYSSSEIRNGYQARGFLANYVPTATYDFYLYLRTITSMSTASFTSRYLNSYPLIKQKYDIAVQYMKERYGVDLLEIAPVSPTP